jgi:hypothetical protein
VAGSACGPRGPPRAEEMGEEERRGGSEGVRTSCEVVTLTNSKGKEGADFPLRISESSTGLV